VTPPAPLDLDGCAALLGVSRETLAPCGILLQLLERWQRAINLVGRSGLVDPWRRHVLDSAQLVHHLPCRSPVIVDLGSGAGFPGLVLAVVQDGSVHLIESNRKKAAFLAEAAQRIGARAVVHGTRIQELKGWSADVITARGLAPVAHLLELSERFLARGTRCLFLKSAAQTGPELTAAALSWHMVPRMFPSLSDPRGGVLQIEEVVRASDP